MLLADIGDSVNRGFTVFFAWVPALIGAIVVLIIGYFVAKFLGNVVARVLQRAGLDRTLHSGQGGQWISKITSSPSTLLGRFTFWALFLGVVSLAVTVLGIEALTDFVAAIYSYLPNILMALVIFLVAGALAGAIAGLVARTMGDTALGKIVGTVAPVLIIAIAGFMILDALQIAETIVTITYAALMGSVALGMALAFGLGGREVAAQMLQGAYQKGQENKGQFKQDLQQGKENARQEAQQVKEKAQEKADSGTEGDAVSGPPARTEEPVTRTQETIVIDEVPADEVPAGATEIDPGGARVR
jgi:mechanosensitive ion channel-like protein